MAQNWRFVACWAKFFAVEPVKALRWAKFFAVEHEGARCWANFFAEMSLEGPCWASFFADRQLWDPTGRVVLRRGPGRWVLLLAVLTLQCAAKPT